MLQRTKQGKILFFMKFPVYWKRKIENATINKLYKW